MDTKKLKSITAELKKASDMHKAQAIKIYKILKSSISMCSDFNL